MLSIVERLAKKVIQHDGCWEWTGGTAPGGYGVLRNEEQRMERAHRVSYRLNKGEIPKGLLVCHSCDMPSCTNPAHLFLGTHKENTQDMLSKGRGGHHKVNNTGINNPNSKLTTNNKEEIEFLLLLGTYTIKILADYYGVHRVTIKYAVPHLIKKYRRGWIRRTEV